MGVFFSINVYADTPSISYSAHVSNIGWQSYVSNGATAGTTGKSEQLEALKVRLIGVTGTVSYRVHVADTGWMSWVSNNTQAGTTGQGRRIEAVQIKLSGEAGTKYDIYYRTHVKDLGWLGWAKNGATSGTTGCGLRAEAIQIRFVRKNEAPPGTTAYAAVSEPIVKYKAHVSDIGWQEYVSNGAVSGTTGQSKRIEAMQISISDLLGGSGVQYKAHLQDQGWTAWTTSNKIVGTTGKSLRMEAIQIQLTGYCKENFDIYYCVHVANKGWLGWAKNGEKAGTEGGSLAMEAIKIKLVVKGTSFDRGGNAFFDLTNTNTVNANSRSSSFDPIWPLANSRVITTLYYYSSGARHSTRYKYGIDMSAPKGENVFAVEDGTVIGSEYSTTSGFGNWIRIRHKNGKVSLYAHLDTRKVSVGQTVTRGQVIGTVGNTSAKYSVGYHLHFELGNNDASGAGGDPWQEYFKPKYGGSIILTQAAAKYQYP